jgi:hypothetical protein
MYLAAQGIPSTQPKLWTGSQGYIYLIYGLGDTGLKELTLRTSKSYPTNKYGIAVNGTEGRDWKDNLSVYFPSLRTVKDSKGGTGNAGTICFQPKWYTSASFPKQVMRDCIATRPGMLMHSKVCKAGHFQLLQLSKDRVANTVIDSPRATKHRHPASQR